MSSRGPSPHLLWAELACHDGTPYPLDWRDTRGRALAWEFERVRTACGGRPIIVLSAYRTRAYNRAVGGSPKSQHCQGRALDLAPPHGMTVMAFHERILATTQEPGSLLRGVGYYPERGFCHVDVRPTQIVARWAEQDVGLATVSAALTGPGHSPTGD